MLLPELEQWFSEPQLDLSFSFRDAEPAIPEPAFVFSGDLMAATGRMSKIETDGKSQQDEAERPRAKELSKGQMRKKDGSWNDDYQAAGTASSISRAPALPILEFRAMGINPAGAGPTRKSEKVSRASDALLTITKFEATHSQSTYKSPTPQRSQTTETIPAQIKLAMPQLSSVSTTFSATIIGRNLDNSFFTLSQNPKDTTSQPNKPRGRSDLKQSENLGNPQPRPKQFIQQSARRPNNRVVSPRQTSFAVVHKPHRLNGRGSTRRASSKNFQHQSLGKPRMAGGVKNISISSASTHKIQVMRRPSRKPMIVGIPASTRSQPRMPELPTIQTPDVQNLLAGKTAPPPKQRGALNVPTISQQEPKYHLPTTDMLRVFPSRRPTPPPKDIPGRSATPRPALPATKPTAPALSQRNQIFEPQSTSVPSSVAGTPLGEKKGLRTVEWEKLGEIPEIWKIGNGKNSSLFKRLVNLESLDVRSRY